MNQVLKPKLLLMLITSLVLTAGLSACGQKGDLYHPEQQQEEDKKPQNRG